MRSVSPFRKVPGEDARDSEERLFNFLVGQLDDVQDSKWLAYSSEAGGSEGVAFVALLLSNLTEQLAPAASQALDALARRMLGDRLTIDGYSAWLRRGDVDVNRLASFLSSAVRRAD